MRLMRRISDLAAERALQEPHRSVAVITEAGA
jgi:hypothetical protein